MKDTVNEYLVMVLKSSDTSSKDFVQAEKDFIEIASSYCETFGVLRDTFEKIGVAKSVLDSAGLKSYSTHKNDFIKTGQLYALINNLSYDDLLHAGIPYNWLEQAGITKKSPSGAF